MVLENEVIKKLKFSKNVNNKNMPLNWSLLMKKTTIIFDVGNWLWKSEISIFWSLDLEHMLIYQKYFLMKNAEVAEKFFNVI